MTGEPLVSVVMCAYNGRGLIEAAVSDVLAQSYGSWELVISDDGSTDGTREWLEELRRDERIRIFLQSTNLGYIRNKNFAVGQARGEFITQQDQDDRSHPDRLRRQVAAVREKGLQIAGCGYRRIGLSGEVLFEVSSGEDTIIRKKGEGDYPFWFPALLVSRRVYEKIGLYPPYFAGAYGDDVYWTVRANEKFPIICLADVLYDYVDAPSSITSLMDNPRKLIMTDVLDHLLEQRLMCGVDDLERGRLADIEALERRLLLDHNLLSRRYQIYAARSVDQGRMDAARSLLREAIKLTPMRSSLLRTIFYYVRQVSKKK